MWSMISQECVRCPKVCVISYHALLMVKCVSNHSRCHLVSIVSYPKQQFSSGDDIADDKSNQEQLGRLWLQKAKQGFARGTQKRSWVAMC